LGNFNFFKLQSISLHSRRGKQYCLQELGLAAYKRQASPYTYSWLGVIVLPLMGRVAELHPLSDSIWIRWVCQLHFSTCSFTHHMNHLVLKAHFQSPSNQRWFLHSCKKVKLHVQCNTEHRFSSELDYLLANTSFPACFL
jgi:hypothetical protein